jgi:hypothetical protein
MYPYSYFTLDHDRSIEASNFKAYLFVAARDDRRLLMKTFDGGPGRQTCVKTVFQFLVTTHHPASTLISRHHDRLGLCI